MCTRFLQLLQFGPRTPTWRKYSTCFFQLSRCLRHFLALRPVHLSLGDNLLERVLLLDGLELT